MFSFRTSSDLFYFSELKARAPKAIRRRFLNLSLLPNKNVPLVVHGICGTAYQEQDSPSWFNASEAYQVFLYLKALLVDYGLCADEVAVITPYRKQVYRTRALLRACDVEAPRVGSIEEFQGQERPVVILSLVKSSSQAGEHLADLSPPTLGFLACPKRANVALTRAQSLLVVVADPHVMAADEGAWRAFLSFAIRKGCYKGCDPPDLSIIEG